MHAFDRQTDGQTGGRTDRIIIARPHLHSMLRGKMQKLRDPEALPHLLSTPGISRVLRLLQTQFQPCFRGH